MRYACAVMLLCLSSITLALGQPGQEAKIKQLEQDWAQATLKDGAAAVDKYEADDIVATDPSGRTTSKTQDKQDMTSGDLKFQSMELADLEAHVYGNTAVATGKNTLKGTYKGQDISGSYRFTDTWVKRNGTWQVVATQSNKIQ
jgi:ketosteroid isomerase-like protein